MARTPFDPPSVDLLRASLRENAHRLDAIAAITAAGADPEGVHGARVAARRIRSDLRTFRPVLDREWTDTLRAEVEWIGTELGAVRDLDVLAAYLRRHADALAPDDQLTVEVCLKSLDEDATQSRATLRAIGSNPRFPTMIRDLNAAAYAPAIKPRALHKASRVLPKLVRRADDELRRRVELTDQPDADRSQALHDVRIAAKRARYAAELARPACGKPAARYARAMGEIQTVLGEQNDALIALDWLRRNAATAEPAVAFVLGRLAERVQRDADRALVEWRAVWDRSRRRALRAWLNP